MGIHLEFVNKSKNKGERAEMTTKYTTQPIQTVEELVLALSKEEKSKFGTLLRNMNLSADKFIPYQSWSKNCYTRNCIVENKLFELILICWEGQQATELFKRLSISQNSFLETGSTPVVGSSKKRTLGR